MTRRTITTAVVTVAMFTSSVAAVIPAPVPEHTPSPLRFGADGRFKIVQFTDTHWVPDNDASGEAVERMREVLDAERPDFVIYTGDVVYGAPAREGFEKCLEPVITRGIPWAVTLGNHDDEYELTRRRIFEIIAPMPGNMTGTVEGVSGVTNFALPIMSGGKEKVDGESGGERPAAMLWVFDSHAYSTRPETKGYDWVKHDQIEWFRRRSTEMAAQNGGEALPALAFLHIPLPEFVRAAIDPRVRLAGCRGEVPCAPVVNSGLFAAMVETGGVMGVFVGHDHVNDWTAQVCGITLGYGRFTGGATVYNDIPGGNGARVFVLTEGARRFETWIRLGDGKVIRY